MSQTNPVTKNAYVLYHDNCVDGFGAAWSFHTLAESNFHSTTYQAVNYGKPVPDLPRNPNEHATLFILDFSYPRTILLDLASKYDKIVVLDHHKTAKEELEDWNEKPENVYIEFDMNRSGAMMTWNYFSGADTSELIKYIQDRDLWRHWMYKTHEISAYIAFQEKSFPAYNKLKKELEFDSTKLIDRGDLLLQSHRRHVQSIIVSCKRDIKIEGHSGLVCNCPGQFASDVGHELCKESGTFGATYFHASDDTVKFSLRSEGNYDVSAIAKIFGGGGHRNAAGFILPNPQPFGDTGIILWANQPQPESFN